MYDGPRYEVHTLGHRYYGVWDKATALYVRTSSVREWVQDEADSLNK
jgi:hypothetical protein